MKGFQGRSLSAVWLLLVTVTLVGFAVAERAHQQVGLVALIVLLSGFKARVILYSFMEIGEAPKGFQIFFNLWLAFCVAIILGLYWLAL